MKIEVSYNAKTPGVGVASQLTWRNPDVKAALEKLFHCAPNETITGLILSETGITAFFDKK